MFLCYDCYRSFFFSFFVVLLLHAYVSAPAVSVEESKDASSQRDTLLALMGINQEEVKSALLNLNQKFSHLNLRFGDEFEEMLMKPSDPQKVDTFHVMKRLKCEIQNSLTAPFLRQLSNALFQLCDDDVQSAKIRLRNSGWTDDRIEYYITCHTKKFVEQQGVRRVTTPPGTDNRLPQFLRAVEVVAFFMDLKDTKRDKKLWDSTNPEGMFLKFSLLLLSSFICLFIYIIYSIAIDLFHTIIHFFIS